MFRSTLASRDEISICNLLLEEFPDDSAEGRRRSVREKKIYGEKKNIEIRKVGLIHSIMLRRV